MAEKFGKQVKIYYTNNKQTTSVTGIDASSYILFNGGSNHIYTHGKDFAADPSHTHDYLTVNKADTAKFNSPYHDFQALYAGGNNGIEGRPSDVEAFGLLRFGVASSWSGQMLLANGGDLYIRSAVDNAFNKSLPWKRIIDSGNIGSQSVNYANSAGNADTVDGLHANNFVKALGTSNDNIDEDWGQSFKTFDPIPSGTPPEQNPNISLLSIGDNFNRRKQLAFMYNNDNIYYRRNVDGSFTNWRRLAFVDSNVASATNADTVDGAHLSDIKNWSDRTASAYWKAGWYKVASAKTATNTEAFLTLDVNAVQSNGHATLFVRKRADSKPYFICTYNNNLNLADFRLYYNGMSMVLYARVPNDWNGRVFRIISEGREGGYDHIWTLYSNMSSTDPNAISAEGENPYINPTYSGRVDWSNSSDKANIANTANIANSLYASCASNDYIGIKGGESNDNGYLEIYTGDNGNEPIYLRQYNYDSSVAIHSATLLDSNGNTSFPGTISSNGHTVLTNSIDPIISVACTSSGILTFTSNNNNKYEFNFNHTHDLSQLSGKIKVECLPDAALKDTTYSYSVTQSATNNNANPYLTLTPSNSGTVSNIQLAGGSNVTITRDSASKIIISSSWRPLGTGSNDAAAGNHTHDFLVVDYADSTSFNAPYHDFQVLYAGGSNGIEGRPSDVDAFGLLRFRVASSWSGQMLLANGGDLYIRSAVDGSFNKSLPWKRIIDSGNIRSQSVNYATNAGNADTVDGVHLDWSSDYTAGNYLAIWDNAGNCIRSIPKGSTSVGYATSAGNAESADYASSAGNATNAGHAESADYASSAGNATNAGNADTVDGLHANNFVKALGTSNDNIDEDWGQSFKTFDPIPSGTPPEQNPNISLLSIGDNFNRRKQLAFMHNNDNIYYRRNVDGSFTNWRRLAFVDSNVASATNADTAIKLKDYNGSNNIYCGYAGVSLNSDNIGYMVGIKANPTGNDIYYKNVSKSELQKWLGLDSYVKKSGDTMSGCLNTTVIELFAPTPYIDFHYNNSSSDYTSRIVEYTSGVLTITGRLEIYNNLSAQGGKFSTDDNGAYWTSDIRKKHDFSNITKDIADKFFEKNYFKHFKWNDTNHDSWGVAAQEFEEWAPEAINTNEDGFKSANYDVAEAKAIAAMTYKIKEQQVTINELKEKLKNFEKMLNKLI